MADVLTAAHVNHLSAIMKLRARSARAEVNSRAATVMADFEEAMQAVLDPQDAALAELYTEAEGRVASANRMLGDRAASIGVPRSWAPIFTVTFPARTAGAVEKRRAELRRVAKARVQAAREAALLEIERVETSLIADLHATQILTETSQMWLDSMPTAASLMPALDFAQIEALSAPPKALPPAKPASL